MYFIISKKEDFLYFKKIKHTFLTFLLDQKRWKKEGHIGPPKIEFLGSPWTLKQPWIPWVQTANSLKEM